jgi:Tfp pilus assembly protein PilE
MRDNRGMGMVEVILILAVLIISVLIFRNQLVWLIHKAVQALMQ